jgi:hypothetical protein
MKRGHVFGLAAIGLAVAAACGGVNSAGDDGGIDGTSSGSGSGSAGGSGSVTGSSGGRSASGSGAVSSGGAASSGSASSSGGGRAAGGTSSSSSGGRRGADAGGNSSGVLTRSNDCPNCPGSQVCCLTPMGGGVQGTCAASASACPSNAASIVCGTSGDCNSNNVCCVAIASAGGPSSTSCTASCPSGSAPACGGAPGDNVDCPGGPAGWACQPVHGTPMRVLGQCVPTEGGTPPADGGGDATATDSGAADTEGGTPPQDAAADGG